MAPLDAVYFPAGQTEQARDEAALNMPGVQATGVAVLVGAEVGLFVRSAGVGADVTGAGAGAAELAMQPETTKAYFWEVPHPSEFAFTVAVIISPCAGLTILIFSALLSVSLAVLPFAKIVVVEDEDRLAVRSKSLKTQRVQAGDVVWPAGSVHTRLMVRSVALHPVLSTVKEKDLEAPCARAFAVVAS